MTELQRAHGLSAEAAASGYDWDSTDQVLLKIVEEVGELVSAKDKDHAIEEACDIIFVVTNFLRWMGVDDPEVPMRKVNEKFERRWNWVNILAARDEKFPRECSAEEIGDYWKRAKDLAVTGVWELEEVDP